MARPTENVIVEEVREDLPKVTKTNPCLCEECAEKDSDGKPIVYYEQVKLPGSEETRPKPGTAHFRSYRTKHWYCNGCRKKFTFPDYGREGKLPSVKRYQQTGPQSQNVTYLCGMCQGGALPEHQDKSYQ